MKEKKYLMVDDYILDNVLDKIKEIIGTEKIILRFRMIKMINWQMAYFKKCCDINGICY